MSKQTEVISLIEKVGAKAKGKGELLSYLYGKKITARQAILAKCYDCTGYYADGRDDCKIETCSLYPFSPYGSKPAAKKQVSEENKKAAGERLSKLRSENRL